MSAPELRRTRRASAALLGLAAVAVAPAARAAGPAQAVFALRPVHFDTAMPATRSYFVLRARPGQTIASEVRVTNVGAAAGTALLYPVDATTGQTSGAVYESRGAARRDVGAWLRVAATSVALRPGESRIVAFELRVPAHVRPGDHLGGIVAENTDVRGATAGARAGGRVGGFRIRIRQLTIVAVQVELPGARIAELQLGSVGAGGSHGYQQLLLALRNTGTVMLKPTGTLTVTDDRRRRVAHARLRLDTFLPRTAIDYPVLVRGRVLPAGSYRAHVVLRYDGHSIGAERPFTIGRAQVTQVYSAPPAAAPPAARAASTLRAALPWALAGLGLAVGAAALVVATRRGRRPA